MIITRPGAGAVVGKKAPRAECVPDLFELTILIGFFREGEMHLIFVEELESMI